MKTKKRKPSLRWLGEGKLMENNKYYNEIDTAINHLEDKIYALKAKRVMDMPLSLLDLRIMMFELRHNLDKTFTDHKDVLRLK